MLAEVSTSKQKNKAQKTHPRTIKKIPNKPEAEARRDHQSWAPSKTRWQNYSKLEN